MSRELLTEAREAIEDARDSTTSTDRRERLHRFAAQLQSQADRETTPALGTLDRVQTKLRDIQAESDEDSVADALQRAREHILDFLGTLDDRGMQQHRG